MSDRRFSALHTAATFLWIIGLALIAADLTRVAPTHPLGLLSAVGAMTLNTRGFLCHLEQRTDRAFDVGRNIGRDEVSQLTRR